MSPTRHSPSWRPFRARWACAVASFCAAALGGRSRGKSLPDGIFATPATSVAAQSFDAKRSLHGTGRAPQKASRAADESLLPGNLRAVHTEGGAHIDGW